MPKFPIPDDWDGQAWRCVQVEWPDSPQYRAVLLGFMTYLTRGRAWNEGTGTITDAQVVGREIYARNYPFNPCDGESRECEVCTTGGFAGLGGGCEDDDCEECTDMACITAIKIENGILYVQYGCCEWVEVGPVDDSTVQSLPDLPWEQPGQTPPAEYSGCGKAQAVVDALWRVGDSAYDHRLDAPIIFQRKVEAESGIKLNWYWSLILQSQAVLVEAIWTVQLFDPEVKAEWICTLDRWFEDDGNGMNADTVQAFAKHVVLSNWGNLIDDAFAGNFWLYVINAIGNNNFNNIAKIGAKDVRDDCDCPENLGLTPPPFSQTLILYDVIAEMEVADCTATYNNKVFDGITVPGAYIQGSGETDTTSNRSCDLEQFDAPALAVLAGDEVWILPSLYSKGPSTSFNFELGITLHRTGGDTEVLQLFGDGDEIEALPGSWSRLMTLTGDPAELTRVYGGFKWWADGENIDFKIARLIIMRPT